jgi:two-component system sensor histidine kinase/response regulator
MEKTKAELVQELEELRRRVEELEEAQEEHRLAEERHQQGENVLEAVLNCTADGILAVNRNGKVILYNKRFMQLWRIPPDLAETHDDNEFLQFVLDQLVDPEQFLARVRELYLSFKESLDTLQFRDGRVFERYSYPLVRGDELLGRVWSFRKVTGNRRAKETEDRAT